MRFRLTINGKMLLYILGVAAIIYVGSLGYIGLKLYHVSTQNATETSHATASEYTNMALQNLSKYEQAASLLSTTFSSIDYIPETKRRAYVMEVMKQSLIDNPNFLSIWTIWEPYTIDQLDSLNRYAPGCTYIGSFSPSLYRENGEIKLEVDTTKVLFQGQYYIDVKACECPILLEPYFYSGSNEDSILQTNLVIPIFKNNEFQGVVGIDIPLSYFQEKFSKVSPLNTGEVYVLSNKGVVVSCPDASLIGSTIKSIIPNAVAKYNVFEQIAAGETFNFYEYNALYDDKAYMAFQPIQIGKVTTPWSFCVSIPKKAIYSQSNKSLANIVFIALVGLLIISVAIGLFARSISRPLLKVTKALENLANGNIDADEKVKYKINDEIGDLAGSVNELFDGLNSAAQFAGEIGKGNLQTEYKLLSHYDELGSSLLEMQKSLVIAKQDEDKKKILDDNRNWVTHGLARFGEVIRKDNDDMVKFSTNVVSELVKYMNVAQAAIFISEKDQYEDTEEEFVLKAAIAYDKLVMLEKRIARGHEMLGRSVEENKVIHLTGLPQDFVEISPGLKNEKRPDNLLISPLTVNEVTFGVVELLSYHPFLEHHIDFIEKLSENVASVISSVNTNVQTAKLLEQSQYQADELAQHEEEMRQNLEEMQATQEEASKREAGLSSFIKTVQKSFMTAELDLNGRVLNMSPAMLLAHGVGADSIQGKYYDAFVAQNESLRIKFNEFWEELIRNGKGKRKHILTQRNKTQVIHEEYLVVEQEGTIPKVILIATDRTIQDELNKELKKVIKASK